jgi:hypothetical protein
MSLYRESIQTGTNAGFGISTLMGQECRQKAMLRHDVCNSIFTLRHCRSNRVDLIAHNRSVFKQGRRSNEPLKEKPTMGFCTETIRLPPMQWFYEASPELKRVFSEEKTLMSLGRVKERYIK